MRVTAELLSHVYGLRYAVASTWVEPLNAALDSADISTKARLVDFLAQVGHESGRLRYTAEIWGPTPQQLRYERDFTAPWSGRRGAKNRLAYNLGNYRRGDGLRYRGAGLIQVTGRANTAAFSARVALTHAGAPNFTLNPEQLRVKYWAALSAADYWRQRRLNTFADAGDFAAQTKAVNGGYNGLSDRQLLRTRAAAYII